MVYGLTNCVEASIHDQILMDLYKNCLSVVNTGEDYSGTIFQESNF